MVSDGNSGPYSAADIEVLSGVDAVRKRPGMYVGDTTDGSGLHHLLWEVVGNVVDLHLAKHAHQLVVVIDGATVEVRDDGPGIPVDVHAPTGKSTLEMVFTQLHAGATFDGHYPHVHLGAGGHGVGLAAVNALSERLEAVTTRHGVSYAQRYARGVPLHGVEVIATQRAGTTIRFTPDPQIFATIEFDLAQISERLQELAWLLPMLRITLQGVAFDGTGGIARWIEGDDPIEARLAVKGEHEDVYVEVALAWRGDGAPVVHSFVNLERTARGPHVHAVWAALGNSEKLAPGLVALVHVGLLRPRWGGPRRGHLDSPEAGVAVEAVLRDALEHPSEALQRFLLARLL